MYLQLFGGRGSAGGNNPAGATGGNATSRAIRQARALANRPVEQRTVTERRSSQSKKAQEGARAAQELATRASQTREVIRSSRELANRPIEQRTNVNRKSTSTSSEVKKKIKEAQSLARRNKR